MAAARSEKPAANQRNPRIPLNWLSDSDTRKSSCVALRVHKQRCVRNCSRWGRKWFPGVILRSDLFALAAAPEPPPHRGINRQTAAYARRVVDETAVVTNRPISEQTRQQGQGVLGDGRVDKCSLSLQGSRGATAWLAVIVESRVHYLRK